MIEDSQFHTHDAQSTDTDQSLAENLSRQLGCEVRLVRPGETLSDANANDLVRQVIDDPSQPHWRWCESDGDSNRSLAGLSLPSGTVAIWNCPSGDPGQLARHAQSVLRLQGLQSETNQLQAEVDSLTTQVMQDFEELSLIRSLSSSLKLPHSAEATDEFILASLMPLVVGVGATSIVAVMTGQEESDLRIPIWTNDIGISDESIHELVRTFAPETAHQPIVKNKVTNCVDSGVAGLREFVMVQCSSEARRHGWIIACNRTQDAVADVPWAQLGFTTVQASLMETAANQLAAQLHNVRLLKQKEELFTDVVRALVNAVEARDPYTCGHSERVASFARCLASHAGYTQAEKERIYLTGLLHDVGKIAIPDGVLQKPSRLDENERAIIETHTDAGWRILHELEALQDVLPGVLYHHENFNGKGYPDQLVGENIPIDGRILAVCDAFDAMTSDRPYRKGMSIDRAVEILREGSGEFWDPKLVDLFIVHLDEIDEIRIRHQPRQPASRPAPVNGVPVIGISQAESLG